MLEPETFRKKMYCTEESTCDCNIVVTFGTPAVIRRPGNFARLAPLLTPMKVR